ncbi:hypothetical protein [Gluconacetobacter diazotrophicus]|uniref:hypothetical protein n=1 Tax=Gluconacetobacter diazotrophicus TaxID=33996 RepID=UPI00119A4B37|nr:hypothetical protein [Gluconacetobacter diazotrophicus]TWB02757.1 hypothetical protein FBZ86_1262 [Gluconacetobacter diazotrophicus]
MFKKLIATAAVILSINTALAAPPCTKHDIMGNNPDIRDVKVVQIIGFSGDGEQTNFTLSYHGKVFDYWNMSDASQYQLGNAVAIIYKSTDRLGLLSNNPPVIMGDHGFCYLTTNPK